MVKRNPSFARLSSRYLFPEIQARKRAFLDKNPDIELISLGVGDTTEPIPPSIVKGLTTKAAELATLKGYTGYSPEQGIELLRKKIAETFYPKTLINADDIFVSDGTKCDIGRLQQLFGPAASVAIQDPSYPVYIDGSILAGVEKITFMPCSSDNLFFPNLSRLPPVDLIYFCSPNNPTGAAASKEQLTALVDYAKAHRAIILYDAAYACYIRDPNLPKSIYEIPGAETVAIELGSFSKLAGFTGVRLGWAVVPAAIAYDDGSPVRCDWSRLTSTVFNAASNIAQHGGLAALQPEGQSETSKLIEFYLENASLIRSAISGKGLEVYGGDNAPYLWVKFPGRKSWDVFTDLLEKAHVVTTPGVGFGPAGEGFIRFSALAHRHHVLQAVERISQFSP